MSWRDLVRRRAERQRVEERRRRMRSRGEATALRLLVLGGVPALAADRLLTGEAALGAVLVGAMALAALFALWVRRAHRSKGSDDLRRPREPEAIRWEEDA